LKGKKLIGSIEPFLHYSLIAILILAALAFSFVFFINWEDWFFGTKLDGMPAGLYLFIKAITAILLAYLLIRWSRYRSPATLVTIAFFGFLFFDSAVTIQKNSGGRELFSVVLALFLLIPILSLIAHHLSLWMNPRREPVAGETVPGTSGSPEGEVKRRLPGPAVLIAGAIIALVLVVFILIPVLLSALAPYVPFIADLGAPPTRDTLITKIDPRGTMEWQAVLPGYSLEPVQVLSLPECGYIVYGTYWISGKSVPAARAAGLGCRGTPAWDFSRALERGALMPGTIRSVKISDREYILYLDTGKILRLDSRGNVLGEEAGDNAGTLVVSAGSPIAYSASMFPAISVSVRIRSGGEEGVLFTIEDTHHHEEILEIYSVNPTSDGGYLVSASINHPGAGT